MYYIIAILLALGLSAFQYRRKALWLFILRFFTYLTLFLLLFNPQIEKKQKITNRPDLYVLADNSFSLKKQNMDKLLNRILKAVQQSDLSKHYNLHLFRFDQSLQRFDSLNFSGNKTDIAQTLSELKFLHTNEHQAPVILLTDGQATTGKDYIYTLKKDDHLSVFPLVLGDTIQRKDIRIDMLNVNPYAYKGNRFPVEIFIDAQLQNKATTRMTISEKGKTLYSQKIELSPEKPSTHISVLLPANSKGIHHYTASLSPLANERNKLNNRKYFAVEVIDNARKIALLSAIVHPDMGAIKRSLRQNPYIQVSLYKPADNITDFDKINTFVLYQPTGDFQQLFKQIQQKGKSWLIITGKHTDWNFLNRQKLFFNKKSSGAYENYFPVPNPAFSLFKLPELQVKDFPPLQDYYGNIEFEMPAQPAYYSRIKSVTTKEPLMAFNEQKKQGVIFGENLWQWRMQAGLQDQTKEFDKLIQQIFQYLSLDKDVSRLQVQYDKQYYQGDNIEITARFLNKNLEPDDKANSVLYLKSDTENRQIPMSLQGDFYAVNLSDLPVGSYRFTVMNAEKSLKKSGVFKVLPFSIEEKNLSADVSKLQTLAERTGGKIYYPTQSDDLIKFLSNGQKFPAIVEYKTQKTDLIDYRWLLALLVLLLATEWLVKKLRGEL